MSGLRSSLQGHDVSACLLRDGAIAYAIGKERITRQKHDTGFYQEVVDYCLKAEGISVDDVALFVRNCYVLPVGELEIRMVSQDVPEIMTHSSRYSRRSLAEQQAAEEQAHKRPLLHEVAAGGGRDRVSGLPTGR